jgi:hypothetical protein
MNIQSASLIKKIKKSDSKRLIKQQQRDVKK